MRIPALTVLAFVASGCTIHVVEEPNTPIAQQPVPVLVAAPPPAPVVVATAPSPALSPATAGPAPSGPSPSAVQLPTTPVRTRPRPELVSHTQAARPVRFKDTKPEPRTTEVASVATPAPKPTRVEKHRRYDKDHASLADVAQSQ
ncbi:MAG TPA: hypothetical protein VNG33_12410 [Polyangiaceae bacterium]|nr:hypothetical protein [Polyangiaceae bacterium]